jgi:hypothetical protein
MPQRVSDEFVSLYAESKNQVIADLAADLRDERAAHAATVNERDELKYRLQTWDDLHAELLAEKNGKLAAAEARVLELGGIRDELDRTCFDHIMRYEKAETSAKLLETQRDALSAALREALKWFGPGKPMDKGCTCETLTDVIDAGEKALAGLTVPAQEVK